MTRIHFLLALGVSLSFALSAGAGDISGAKKLICAPSLAIDCGADGECESGPPESIDFPRFVRVDLDKRVVLGEAADGNTRTSEILHVASSEGATILQGVQLGRGWSAVIERATGKLVVTASATDAAFVIFGACTTD